MHNFESKCTDVLTPIADSSFEGLIQIAIHPEWNGHFSCIAHLFNIQHPGWTIDTELSYLPLCIAVGILYS